METKSKNATYVQNHKTIEKVLRGGDEAQCQTVPEILNKGQDEKCLMH